MLRAVFLLIVVLPISAQQLPRFEDYPAKIYAGKMVPPKAPNARDREIKCCAWADDTGPINFAGNYRLTEDTCGSECVTVHIVNRATGEHFVVGSYGYSYIFGLDRRPNLPHGLEYKATSRLLIIHGCQNEEKCGSYYLLMSPNGLKQVRYAPFAIEP